jgi:hypothetical protein
MAVCCHCLFRNTTTIEKGDDIAISTFFAIKPSKKAIVIIVTFFCTKAIKEGDGSYCHLLLLLYNTTTKEGFFIETTPQRRR